MAVKWISKSFWEPRKAFCVIGGLAIWGFSAAAAIPMLKIYKHFTVYVVPLPANRNENVAVDYYSGFLCVRGKVTFDCI